MYIMIQCEDFNYTRYNLSIKDTVLEFAGEEQSFSLLYREINDFCVTYGKQGKSFFTMLCIGRIYEGWIMDTTEVEPFMIALKEKMDGVINIEVKRHG